MRPGSSLPAAADLINSCSDPAHLTLGSQLLLAVDHFTLRTMRSGAPFLLLFLLFLLAESTATPAGNDTGREFVVVFPENIASYHPAGPQNKVWITALYDGTRVTLNLPSGSQNPEARLMQAGQTHSFDVNIELKEFKNLNESFSLSDQTLHITSDKRIVVQAFSSRSRSMQTALVIPADQLGKKYFIPPVPPVYEAAGLSARERSPFRLLIVNAGEENTVTVAGEAVRKQVKLRPKQAAQIWLQEAEALRVVEAAKPVAVLFGHPCALKLQCTCGLLYAVLQPAKAERLKFPIPPGLATGAEDNTVVLLSEMGSSRVEAFKPDSAVVETSGTAVLHRPGLLLTLIPQTDFASCYVVTKVSEQVNRAMIVVHKDSKDGIHVGSNPLESEAWQEMKKTEYVSTVLTVSSETTVIWHASSRMGVYFMGEKNGTLFGNPAPIISPNPDYRGCALIPEVVNIPEDAGSWPKSITTCSGNLKMVRFPNKFLHKQVCNFLSQAANSSPQEVWISLRRSSASGEWYWLDDAPVNYTGWEQGEPGGVEEGQCAVMSLTRNKGCGWRDEDCCKAIRPLCYRQSELLELQ